MKEISSEKELSIEKLAEETIRACKESDARLGYEERGMAACLDTPLTFLNGTMKRLEKEYKSQGKSVPVIAEELITMAIEIIQRASIKGYEQDRIEGAYRFQSLAMKIFESKFGSELKKHKESKKYGNFAVCLIHEFGGTRNATVKLIANNTIRAKAPTVQKDYAQQNKLHEDADKKIFHYIGGITNDIVDVLIEIEEKNEQGQLSASINKNQRKEDIVTIEAYNKLRDCIIKYFLNCGLSCLDKETFKVHPNFDNASQKNDQRKIKLEKIAKKYKIEYSE